MGSQFVDFNGDGHVDYLSATFDGSPHISYGSKEGWSVPVRLKDAQGERILITSFWNYEARQHQETSRAMSGDDVPKERCISALAFDWDGDGDYDLLLGSYENGHLYRQMNEGTNAAPKFTGKNIPVLAGKVPFAIEAKMTAPRLVDWDNDGDLDLIAGSFGDSYGKDTGGGVYLSRNLGKKGAPRFGPLETLIEPSKKGQNAPTRPDAGLYVDAADYDGDGDLDLIVGGYSMWMPKQRQLTEEDQATVGKLQSEQKEAVAARTAISNKMMAEIKEALAGKDMGSPEGRKISSEVRAKYGKDLAPLNKSIRELSKELQKLVPGKQRASYVWLYERR